jgi:hypothetical protein
MNPCFPRKSATAHDGSCIEEENKKSSENKILFVFSETKFVYIFNNGYKFHNITMVKVEIALRSGTIE